MIIWCLLLSELIYSEQRQLLASPLQYCTTIDWKIGCHICSFYTGASKGEFSQRNRILNILITFFLQQTFSIIWTFHLNTIEKMFDIHVHDKYYLFDFEILLECTLMHSDWSARWCEPEYSWLKKPIEVQLVKYRRDWPYKVQIPCCVAQNNLLEWNLLKCLLYVRYYQQCC